MTQRALDSRNTSVLGIEGVSTDCQTLTEKCGDPKHISRVLEGFEHKRSQERDVNESKDERERKGVDQDGLGMIRWLDDGLESVGIHDHNGGNKRV